LRTVMTYVREIFVILLMGLVSIIPAKFAHAETVLSKEDAEAMFNLSFSKWKQNVLAVQEAGLAKYDSLAPLEVTMIADVPFGRVVTTPSYKSAKLLPWKLSVAIIFEREASQLLLSLPSSEHKKSISEIYFEMMPDYTVMTEIFLPNADGFVVKNFQLFRYENFPPWDAAAEKYKGCWQKCLKCEGS
ncbi:hypothetical protein N8500_11125, partial [Candidatus Puniceispirillum sp.]|nr:hypothetical protein [Candidatus Puniceispirillum sp.]